MIFENNSSLGVRDFSINYFIHAAIDNDIINIGADMTYCVKNVNVSNAGTNRTQTETRV